MYNKKAQEEFVGFILIIIIVSVILLVFLGLSIRNNDPSSVEDYEVKNFLQSILQYTSDCQGVRGDFRDIEDLIFDCKNGEYCLDPEINSRKACDVLNNTSREIIEESWQIGVENPVKAYNFTIILDEVEVLTSVIDGENSANFRGNYQNFYREGASIDIYFEVYY